jgi:serine/threonine protein phosphatase 1
LLKPVFCILKYFDIFACGLFAYDSRMRAIAVSLSEWKPAPFALNGETVFAIGDVHGCGDELESLLDEVRAIGTDLPNRKELVFLGDLIDRGPRNLKTLRLWANAPEAYGVDATHRLLGNHEQLLMLAMAGGPHAQKARAMWLSDAIGGRTVLNEMQEAAGRSDADPSAQLFRGALGEEVYRLFMGMQSHVALGNTIFVHAGLEPKMSVAACLAVSWQSFTEARWAWVHADFLQWQGGFAGKVVVHGHTPPHMHREMTGQDDPHLFAFDRLGLDGGTTRTGIVVGAQVETGRYRILRAAAATGA